MQDAIGQNQVLVPPMQMALVAEAIANQGVILQPHVVDCVLDPNDKVVSRVGVQQYKRAIDPATAEHDDARSCSAVVNDPRGTGTAAQIPSVAGRGQDRHRARPAPGENAARVVHRVRAGRPPAVRDRGARRARRIDSARGRPAAGSRRRSPKQVLQTLLTTPTPTSPCGAQPGSPSNGG